MRRRLLAALLALIGLGATAAPAIALPGWPSVGISSSHGSGAFGRWFTKRHALRTT